MKSAIRLLYGWMPFAIVAVLVCWFSAFPAVAQQGQDAVYNLGGVVTNSPAFIDASMFVTVTGTNICGVLHSILIGSSYPAAGAVIDARGLANSNPSTSMTCTIANPSPWAGITNPPPSTILLPATGGLSPNPPNPIIIPGPWTLAANTHLIGEGDGITSNSFSPGTTIQATTGFSGSMIQFEPSSSCPSGVCTGISVENLTLDGNAQSINGISNQYAQTNSYVNRAGGPALRPLDESDFGCPTLFAFFAKGWHAAPEYFSPPC